MIKGIIGAILIIAFAHAPSSAPPPTWSELIIAGLVGMIIGGMIYWYKRYN